MEGIYDKSPVRLPAINISGWNMQVRPANHPARRLAALAALVYRYREAGLYRGLCGLLEKGSGAGLEKYYSAMLLLINRLLGVSLPRRREEASSCFFLSSSGCGLVARHVLCINYVCSKITSRTKPGPLAALREAEGEEIHLLFQVNEKLRHLVHR